MALFHLKQLSMNRLFLPLMTLLALLSAVTVQAQFGNGNGFGGNRDAYGRRISAMPNTPAPEPEPENLTAEQMVEQQLPAFKAALELNDFELAVLQSVLTRHVQKRIETQLLKLSPEKTMETMEAIQKSQDEELAQGLPPEKYEKYLALQEVGFSRMEKKNKQKKKKKT